jgi:glucosylceramidase
VGLLVLLAACGSGGQSGSGGSGGATGGAGAPGTGGASGQPAGSGAGGAATGGNGNTAGASAGNPGNAGTSGGAAGTGGGAPATGGSPATGGGPATGGSPATGGVPATGGSPATGGAGAGGTPLPANVLVTSAPSNYWKTGTFTQATTGTATVTVDEAATAQTWYGFGGTFNEIGWSLLTTKELQDQAVRWLFSPTDGANLAWGFIPIGASDYAKSRYTLDDTGTDVRPDSGETNRPPADTALASFSLDRDGQLMIPYVKAAQAVKRDLRFWASPWTPPVWMKTGYKKDGGGTGSVARVPSYFDGGKMRSDDLTLAVYAQYFAKFVQGYRDRDINIEVVSPQEEPTFEQNFPSCIWDKATFATFIGKHLGPAMKTLNVSVMLGNLTNSTTGNGDIEIAKVALADPAASSFIDIVGVEWGVLDSVNDGLRFGELPIWATTHKYGNYPFCGGVSSGCPGAYNSTQAPNDHAYGIESWGYIRNAITKGHVSVYNAWNMVLDKYGLGIDTSRDWKQDALLVVDGGKVTATPAYYVFRHLSQYVVPGAKVVGTSGGDAVAFKNPDGSLVVVAYNSGAANNNFIVAIGAKKLQFAMPANGWATVKYTP